MQISKDIKQRNNDILQEIQSHLTMVTVHTEDTDNSDKQAINSQNSAK